MSELVTLLSLSDPPHSANIIYFYACISVVWFDDSFHDRGEFEFPTLKELKIEYELILPWEQADQYQLHLWH